VQKFTRPLTREIEVADTRLALTLDDRGISVRIVGSRRAPWEISWPAVLWQLTGHAGTVHSPTAEDLAAAVEKLRKGEPPAPMAPAARQPEPAAESPEVEPAPSAERVTPPPTVSGRLSALLGRLEQWLAIHRPGFHRSLEPGASPAEVDAVQAELGFRLPEELRTLVGWHNGQGEDFGHFERNWDLMSLRQIADTKSDMDAADRSESGWNSAWVPFLSDDAGDYLVLDTGRPERPVREYGPGRPEHPAVADSLADWLERFVGEVEKGGYVEDPERGTFLRRR
jgi:cell wall assembly regulator SMI1